MKHKLITGLLLWGWMSVSFALELSGFLIQGGWAQVKTLPGSEIHFNQRVIRADAEGLALIAFSRDATNKQSLKVLQDGQPKLFEFTIDERDYQVQRINGLPPKHVTPDADTLAKIKQDRKKAVEARKIDIRTPYFLKGFDWPAEGWITGIYGSQRILNGHARAPHMGVDIAAKTGTPIYAPAAGEITLAEDMQLSGHTLFIDHGYGLRSDFMHLDKILVKKGELVEKGQLVATMGATGRATGPHLHWGMSWFNVRIDPALALSLDRTLEKGAQVVNNQVIYEQNQAGR